VLNSAIVADGMWNTKPPLTPPPPLPPPPSRPRGPSSPPPPAPLRGLLLLPNQGMWTFRGFGGGESERGRVAA
jgi:hypothetical protein